MQHIHYYSHFIDKKLKEERYVAHSTKLPTSELESELRLSLRPQLYHDSTPQCPFTYADLTGSLKCELQRNSMRTKQIPFSHLYFLNGEFFMSDTFN